MKAILVGSGGTTRELLRRLDDTWNVVVVSTNEQQLARAQTIRDIRTVTGDGSSRVNLQRAGLDEADALIAASSNDDHNLEAVRIGKAAGLLRIAAVAVDPERMAEYRALDVPVFSPDSLTARHLEVHLEPRRIASTAFARGRAEAVEFRVSSDSPVVGKSLAELRSETWLVAAVLRNHQLIVPHGSTVLQIDDLVTVVGAASDYPRIVQTFTAGEPQFPREWGRKVAVAATSLADADGIVAEAIHLTRKSRAVELVVAHTSSSGDDDLQDMLTKIENSAEGLEVVFRSVSRSPEQAVFDLVGEESIGVVVAPAPSTGLLSRWQTARLMQLGERADVPMLLSRGTYPFRRILVPARTSRAGHAAGRAAIDLARMAGASLEGIAIEPPRFLAGPGSVTAAREASVWLREEAAVQDISVGRQIDRGNPVRAFADASRNADLLVLGVSAWPTSVMAPGTAALTIRHAACSVLVIPESDRRA